MVLNKFTVVSVYQNRVYATDAPTFRAAQKRFDERKRSAILLALVRNETSTLMYQWVSPGTDIDNLIGRLRRLADGPSNGAAVQKYEWLWTKWWLLT